MKTELHYACLVFGPHLVTKPSPPFFVRNSSLQVLQIPVWSNNYIWLLVDEATSEAAVVDGPEARPVLDRCGEQGWSLTTVLNTHTHPDHVGINYELLRLGRLKDLRVVGPRARFSEVPGIKERVGEGDAVELAGVVGRVLLTEGHLNGHISFVFENVLFCGDTLFAGGCGYLFDGPPATMYRSLMRLAQLPGETLVCCAHEYTQDNLRFAWTMEPDNPRLQQRIREVWARRAGGESTVPSSISVEQQTNPFLRVQEPEVLEKLRKASPAAALDTPEQAFAAMRRLKDGKSYQSIPDSALPLR